MPGAEQQQVVLDLLKGLRGLDPLKQLFWTELNYQRVNQPLSRRGWSETAADALANDPLLFAAGGPDNDFEIIYARLKSDKLLLTLERPAVTTLLRDHPYALFVVSNTAQQQWHFINVRDDKDVTKRRLFRRITVGKDERLRTAAERLEMLDLAGLTDLSPLGIQKRHDDAFDVEAVTRLFFDDYRGAFQVLWDDLKRQSKDKSWGHDYALQFLNRCMFLYFIQRKGWLGNDREFLHSFWQSYNRGRAPKDTFVDKWLNVLFFQAFNNKLTSVPRHFPEEVRDALAFAPYLNGGLFTENELDHKCQDLEVTIPDKRFEQVFTFLERYNFTIAEDSPLDQEVAVDPEMIGKVYESLVNVSEEADERGDAGIFYTPRTEIDLMCRLSVVDYLGNHLGADRKNLLYQLVFSLEPEEKAVADKQVADAKLWSRLSELLRDITVLDPACGSGSFPVGMLHVLDDLQLRANQQLGIKESPYDRKRRIIGQSIYGVDVMDWACHVTELRLWLSLIVHADYTRDQLHARREPLLPHFSFKIRCGDSLVQEIGGVDLRQCARGLELPDALKRRITRLKNEKLKFYANDPSCQFKSDAAVKSEEVTIFRDLLSGRAAQLRGEAEKLMRLQAQRPARQQMLDGSLDDTEHQLSLERQSREAEIPRLVAESEEVEKLAAAVRRPSDVFVWDIAFVEIFEGEKGGFDIVVGNPPYVRQENIADPLLPREKITNANKKEYKAKLARSVYQLFSRFFGYKPGKNTVARKLDAKSDLYIYFYFHGLSLLNPNGSFCFITSSSWLDVGYGRDLQEFLLKHGHVKLILDNQSKRSFASADVNTVIVLFSHVNDRREWGLPQVARFVMFKAPFEHMLSPPVFSAIENCQGRTTTSDCRVLPVVQSCLYAAGLRSEEADGCDAASEQDGKRSKPTSKRLLQMQQYRGDKWGGKYLRAPDVYWSVVDRCKAKLVRLGDVADVKFGIKTGANEFFYLQQDAVREWDIEKRFLKPVILRPAEIVMPDVRREHLSTLLFLADHSRSELRGTNAEKYIRWGEKQGYSETATCQARGEEWYRLDVREPAAIVMPIVNKMRLVTGLNEAKAQIDHNCVEIRPKKHVESTVLAALMLGTFNYLVRHAHGRSYGRMIKVETYEAADLLVLDPRSLKPAETNVLVRAFERIRTEPFAWLTEELHRPTRQAFDNVWLTLHGFASSDERSAVLNEISAAVQSTSAEMNAQEEDWIGDREAVRLDGNPQDVMKRKRIRR